MARRDSLGGYEEERFKDKVDIQLQCSLCHKVLKDPVQCPNEHYFCRSCIQNSLLDSEACPVCEHHLTEKTLTKPPRILMGFLQNLEIHCDHENRGCQEFIKLEFLDQHVDSCGYSPTRCTNVGCAEVMNRNEKERHEREQCDFRKIVCDECGEQIIWKSSRVHPCFMRKEMDDLARRLNVVQNDVRVVQNDMGKVNDEVKQVKLTQDEMACITKEAIENYDFLTGKQEIWVFGGDDYDYKIKPKTEDLYNPTKRFRRFLTMEAYNWPRNSWYRKYYTELRGSRHSAFVHGHDIYVGGDHNGIEKFKVPFKMGDRGIELPFWCYGRRMVRHENSAILTGGFGGVDNDSSGIYEISLNPPYDTKLLTQMPEPRYDHGCEIMDNQVIMAGGRASKDVKDTKNTVYVYDLNKNECKTLVPLPYRVAEMATVSYKDNVILIGGKNEKGESLDSVVMYHVKTGQITMLPCLNPPRARSAAVIAGNVIIVIGGYCYNHIEKKIFPVSHVECLDLRINNAWRALSPLEIPRGSLAAVLTTP